jgi:hypothetical protein
MAFSTHFEKWLNDTLAELKRIADKNALKANKIGHKFNGNVNRETLFSMSEHSPYGGGNSREMNNGMVQQGKKISASKHAYWTLTYDEDDALDIVDDTDSRKMSPRERVAQILGKTELEKTDPSETGDDFYELSNGMLSDNNDNFEPDFNFHGSTSLDFSDDMDDRSVTSEPKSYADDPDQFMKDFHRDNDFVEIDRLDSTTMPDTKDRTNATTDFSSNNNSSVGFFNKVLHTVGRGKGRGTRPDNEGFTIRYTKPGETLDDNYIDDDLRPIGLSSEDLTESTQYPSSFLPMTTEIMDSEEETMLDLSRLGSSDVIRGSKGDDTQPIVTNHSSTHWRVKHRKALIIGGVIVCLCMLAVLGVIIFFVVHSS